MTIIKDHSNRARTMWLSCLASSYRTALACTIVGLITLYGPASIRNQVAFPAFSYVTVIIIVTDATLGDTLHGCWLALYATIQTIGPAILSLWLIGPTRFKSSTTALAVALAAYVVALPEATHLKAKRIALGQIVITYVIGSVNGERTEVVMHPVHVAASTGIGVLACIFALLLPYPRLACCQVKRNCKQLAEISSERLKLYVKALCAEDKPSALASISQAKLLTAGGTKLIQSIKIYQESMKWERLPFKFMRPYYMNPGEMLQDVQLPLRGMEMAVTGILSFPVQMLDGELKEVLLPLEERIALSLKKAKSCLPCESNSENIMKFLQTLPSIPKTTQDLPSFFFLFCMKLLHSKSLPKPSCSGQNDMVKKIEPSINSGKQNGFSFKESWCSWSMKAKSKRLMPAFRCSLSLGLAVLFGMLYSKPNGIWSGLPVAISLATAREPTFKVANVKAQGTVIGTVYGVLGCFLFEKYLPIRFLSLLPWFIFTNFLRRSRMYGQAGGISAVIGAVLILGRKNFGAPKEFAIARIVETFIGLSCSIMVDLLFLPTRACTLAKVQLSKSLAMLHDCIGSMSLQFNQANLLQNQKKLKMYVNELGKFIGEAEVEPNFWFLPFNSACYSKLLGSLTKMVDLLHFSAHSLGFLDQQSQKIGAPWKEELHKLNGDLELLKEKVGSSIKCFQKVTMVKSLPRLEKELKQKNISCDLEMGKSPNQNTISDLDENAVGEIISSYLQHSKELVDKIHAAEGDDQKEFKSQVVLSLSALGYCMQSLIRETRQIEEGIKELVQWENPSSNVNLLEISCKIQAFYDKI
ncbi:p-hydroxybenzoic acid efflux pump subunit aaeB [Melia azedarach]|uniref:p-hydroxybenzoic acid efflux pump subunit aaeB n=1 Tax=Melia azedarach TaxID=155640 RepID=A0ACC1YRP0_MELAZ|nr:p-hydroxybenzoic acid efflux pump subunit aaeB [Melia azedarach]